MNKNDPDTINPKSPPKRKSKTLRACINCQKSHMLCDPGRPCKRCIKRNIADSCRDGMRKKAKYLADVYSLDETFNSPDTSIGSSAALTPPEGFAAVHITDKDDNLRSQGVITNANANTNKRTAVSGNDLLYTNSSPNGSSLSADSRPQTAAGGGAGSTLGLDLNSNPSLFDSKAAKLEYSILSNIIRTTQDPLSDVFLSSDEMSVGTPGSVNGSVTGPGTGPASSTNLASILNPVNKTANKITSNERRSEQVAGAAAAAISKGDGLFDDMFATSYDSADPEIIYSSITTPYPYTQGFHGLIRYLKSRFDKQHLMVIAKAMAAYRPSFIASTKRLKEADLIFMEQCFQRTLIDFEKIIAVSGTPTVIWRRTGQIVAVGEEFCLMTEWPRDKLIQTNRFIVELMDDSSVADYFDVFSRLAFGDSRGVTMTECTLLKPSGQRLPTACTWTVRRDVFDIPMMIIGNFLPILN